MWTGLRNIWTELRLRLSSMKKPWFYDRVKMENIKTNYLIREDTNA